MNSLTDFSDVTPSLLVISPTDYLVFTDYTFINSGAFITASTGAPCQTLTQSVSISPAFSIPVPSPSPSGFFATAESSFIDKVGLPSCANGNSIFTPTVLVMSSTTQALPAAPLSTESIPPSTADLSLPDTIAIGVVVPVVTIALALVGGLWWWRRRRQRIAARQSSMLETQELGGVARNELEDKPKLPELDVGRTQELEAEVSHELDPQKTK